MAGTLATYTGAVVRVPHQSKRGQNNTHLAIDQKTSNCDFTGDPLTKQLSPETNRSEIDSGFAQYTLQEILCRVGRFLSHVINRGAFSETYV